LAWHTFPTPTRKCASGHGKRSWTTPAALFNRRLHIARVYAGRRRNFVGQHFWARGYWVSTVGKNEAAVRRYIQDQEKEDQRLEPLELAAL